MTAPGTPLVRDVRDDDDLDALNAGLDTWYGQALFRALFAAAPGSSARMWVAELDGEPVGYAHAVGAGIADGHRGDAHVHVLPQHRRRGVGAALWQRVLTVCTPDRVRGVLAQADDRDTATLDVARSHGWALGGLHQESELDLGTVDGLRHLAGCSRAPGVEIRPLPDDADEEVWRRFMAVYDRLYADAPDIAGGAEPTPYAVLRAVIREPWQVMAAWRGEEVVGCTAVAVRSEPDRRLNTWFTGVARDLRGQGLATALKVTQALALREAGWCSIATQNLVGNDAILASNRRLGFVPRISIRDLVLDF